VIRESAWLANFYSDSHGERWVAFSRIKTRGSFHDPDDGCARPAKDTLARMEGLPMAVDMFLKIDGIKGEAKDSKHKDEIDVLSWSWGVAQAGTAHMGGGAGAGKVNVQDLTFTHYVDRSSPVLLLHCFNGKHIKKAKLTVRKAGEKPLEYLTIEMEDILVSHVSEGGAGGSDRLTENVGLNFAKVKAEYQEQKQDGMAWNIPANKPA